MTMTNRIEQKYSEVIGSFAVLEAQLKEFLTIAKRNPTKERVFITACNDLIQNNEQFMSDLDDFLQMNGGNDDEE